MKDSKMKFNTRKILTLTASLATMLWTSCDDDHGHPHDDGHRHEHGHGHNHSGKDDHQHALTDNQAKSQKESGPNGGRLITSVEPHLEFLVMEDLKILISAVKDRKIIPVENQVVKVIGGDRSNPTELKFSKFGKSLLSETPFPSGKSLPVIVTIKSTQEAETQQEKFSLDLSDCPTCDFKEYACVCYH